MCHIAWGGLLQKPTQYNESKNYIGWYMSEKLDGIRAVWDGKELKTRKGHFIYAPLWFIKQLPPFSVDGELWTKRQDLENIQSIVMDKTPSLSWNTITYNIFEVPNAHGNFDARLSKLSIWLKRNQSPVIKIIEQVKVESKSHLNHYYQQLTAQGAEGFIVKNPSLDYTGGRTSNSVKRKVIADMEATVVKINKGKGKYLDKMGSLTLQLVNGKRFKLGTGFSDVQRQVPPEIGDQVKFKHWGFTKKGIPKYASFLMIRKD